MKHLLRFARLGVLLMLVPLIRSCDDASGQRTTMGVPLPFASFLNNRYGLDAVDWRLVAADAVIIAAVGVLLARLAPRWLARLGHLRIFLVVTGYALVSSVAAWITFIPLLFIALPISFVSDAVPLAPLMDVLSRGLLAGIVAATAASVDEPLA